MQLRVMRRRCLNPIAGCFITLQICSGGFLLSKAKLDDEIAPVLIYHGLNGVYIKDYQKCIRLDARGNKKGVNAQFSIRPQMGECDSFIIYPNPDIKILEKLKKIRRRRNFVIIFPLNWIIMNSV